MARRVTPQMPSSVRVGYRTYRVTPWDVNEATDMDAVGYFSPTKGEIRVREGMDPEETRNTLLHEVLHACWIVGALEHGEFEEKAVTVLANQLTQVIADNPALMAFLVSTTVDTPSL